MGQDAKTMTTHKKAQWKIGRRSFLGLDTWSGRHLVAGFCAIYEVTELNQTTCESRTRVERGEPVYLTDVSSDVAAMVAAYAELQVAIRAHTKCEKVGRL